mgnify:CR=1 FL=1
MLEWFVSSAILLAVLIALHYLLRGKVSPKLQYALWALALVRLLLPFSVGQSYASVENLVPETQHYVLYTAPRTAPAPEASAPSQPQQAAQPRFSTRRAYPGTRADSCTDYAHLPEILRRTFWR